MYGTASSPLLNVLAAGFEECRHLAHFDVPEDERRYSPHKDGGNARRADLWGPRREKICTSHIERQNGPLRQWCKRLTRLTYAFSKLANHKRRSPSTSPTIISAESTAFMMLCISARVIHLIHRPPCAVGQLRFFSIGAWISSNGPKNGMFGLPRRTGLSHITWTLSLTGMVIGI